MTFLGIAALVWQVVSSLAVDLYVGWIFLLSGEFGLGAMFFAPNAGAFIWSSLTGALTLFAGVVLIWHPVAVIYSSASWECPNDDQARSREPG